MAISNNPMMQGMRGTLGKQVVFRIINGRQVVSAYPDMSNVKRSAAQRKQNNRLKKVNTIVAKIKADPELRNAAQLRLDVPGNRLHHALVKEQLMILASQDN